MKLKYFSHSSFQVTTDSGQILLIDPFLDDNPTSPVSPDEVSADCIIPTHGHGDHIGDSFKIAKRCDPLFICVNELAHYCAEQGFRAHNMHIGDTGLFYDMKLIGEMNAIDYMLLPIGDNFTMGIDDAVKAVELTRPQTAIPIHYNTFPVIEADPAEFANKVVAKGFKAQMMGYGEEILL